MSARRNWWIRIGRMRFACADLPGARQSPVPDVGGALQDAWGNESATLAFRFYRPARSARVQIENSRPVFLLADEIRGKVDSAAGTLAHFRRLVDRRSLGPRRVGREPARWRALPHLLRARTGRWFVEGSYD